MTTFASMQLPEVLQDSLSKLQYDQPTPVQAQAIPVALEGRDVLGSAQTGTGKTAAFLIPVLVHLLKPDHKSASALIITPTRELAQQVMTQAIALLGTRTFMTMALLMGGDSMVKQLKQLRQNPSLIIGTPGRINDHIRRRSIDLRQCNFLVLDETDRMLDMGFSVQLETIINRLNPTRQTLLFSATLPSNTKNISDKYLNDPVRIKVNRDNSAVQQIEQTLIKVSEKEKYDALTSQLEKTQGTVIIFMKTKFSTERMAKRLVGDGYRSDAIHGDLRQSRRSRVIESFRKSKFRILVATDVAARGLDIEHVELVINHDLPQSPEDYIHRIGRTGRAGAQGAAVNFVSPADQRKWQEIQFLMNPDQKKNSARQPDRSAPRQSSRPRAYSKPMSQNRGGQGGYQGKQGKTFASNRSSDQPSHRSRSNKPSTFRKPSGANNVFILDRESESIDGVRVNYQPRNHPHGQKPVGNKRTADRKIDGNRWSGQQDGRRSSAKDVDGNKRPRWQSDQGSSRGQPDKKRQKFNKDGPRRTANATPRPQKTFKRAKQPSAAEA